jgi:hypothetical protein
MTKTHLPALAALAAAALATAAPALAKDSLSDVRAATSKFHRLAAAKADGREVLKDAAGIACIENPGVGGMGIHYVKGSIVKDGKINATTPEAVIYEPQPNGGMRLVAVEYVVFKDAWDKAHKGRPSLFGRKFEEVKADNRYGLPPFYELHAWIFKHNSRGMFDDWNPKVSCPG